ncbi:ThiJ/PfpI family protein [Xylariaceae sp. FL0594]|nr:ThiJ/PfpI family protein [Xylariaceae sp. FL0594]
MEENKTTNNKKAIKIGVFVPAEAQLLDLACVDVLHMMSREYLSLIPEIPTHVADLAPSVEISYIVVGSSSPSSTSSTSSSDDETSSDSGVDATSTTTDDADGGKKKKKLDEGLGLGMSFPLTSNLSARATHTINSPEVAPGELDILLVPGPDPSSTIPEAALEFLRAHADIGSSTPVMEEEDTATTTTSTKITDEPRKLESGGITRRTTTTTRPTTDILSVCTGILICGEAGLLANGRTVCGPRGMQHVIRERYPGVRLVGERLRWVRDGNLWSSGGITNGNDLAAAYARQNPRHFPPSVVEIALKMADVGDRPQAYEQSQSVFMMAFAWQIVRGWFAGFFGGR